MSRIPEVAATVARELIKNPTAPEFTDESIRHFQGCPTIAVSKGGRIFAAWYSGGTREPHIENFNLIVKSDDGGETWSKPILVIPSSREFYTHSLDIQLFTAPDGRLFVYWVQNNIKPADLLGEDGKPIYTGYTVDNFIFSDNVHAMWYSVCDDPDADELVFSAPKYGDSGFLRCKPLVMSDGRWLCFNYDQTSDRYGYSISSDNGATYERHYGGRKIPTDFDESMAYEKKNGEIRMLARAVNTGELAESTSTDMGLTWTDGRNSGIVSTNTRFFVARTPSGRILLVRNDHPTDRSRMTVELSDDDGATFPHSVCIDSRGGLSYPDVDFYDGKILLVYDRERTGAMEILFAAFTEEDVVVKNPIEPRVISKGGR